MIGFHIDMNMAHYRANYLRTWLKELARLGYDTVIWEVENSIQWESCPECVAPDAFTKNEFLALLAECRLLGLEPVPLLQTLGHAEYVLKHPSYAHLREIPGRTDQYCPRNPELLPFLHKWIAEYLDLFGPVRHFHIGADETMCLGSCSQCSSFAQEQSLSKLYVEHVNAVARPLLKRGITPVIWADMALAAPQALDDLSRDIMLFDWRYDVYRGCGVVCMWNRAMVREGDAFTFGEPMIQPSQMSAEERGRFETYVWPAGAQGDSEPFYSADYLAAKGFRVVTCPSSSHYGDNCFAPRDQLHAANVFDSFSKGASRHLHGSVLTSWSLHLHPWELQTAHITIPHYLRANPAVSLDGVRARFCKERFGGDAGEFWKMCHLLSGSCLFANTASLGHTKALAEVPDNHVARLLRQLIDRNALEDELRLCDVRREEYTRALELVRGLEGRVLRGHELLRCWKLAARGLAGRAEVTQVLIRFGGRVLEAKALSGADAQQVRIVLGRSRVVRREYEQVYGQMVRPDRTRLMVGYLFGPVEAALARLAGEN